MGTIRVLLAISVVFYHTSGFVILGGQLPVQLFYIISGFFISFVLVECKSYPYVSRFYFNRFLRLFPIYWAVAALTLLMYYLAIWHPTFAEVLQVVPDFFAVYKHLELRGIVMLSYVNIFLFGQELVFFTAVRDGSLQLVSKFYGSDYKVSQGVLVPQAWSLGLELAFYAVAPFLLKRMSWIIGLLITSLLIRLYLFEIDLAFLDPWTYRFFPAELALFLFGVLSHQVLKPFYIRKFGEKLRVHSKFVTALIIIYCLLFSHLSQGLANSVFFMFAFMASLPFLFEFQCSNKWDRKLGDLSYPIYISHMMLVAPVTALVRHFYSGGFSNKITSLCVVVAALLVSLVLEALISRPIEIVRSKVKLL